MSPEAVVKVETAPVETPKTFDLDAMLGTTPSTTSANERLDLSSTVGKGEFETGAQITPAPIETPTIPNIMPTPESATIPVPSPAFTIPTTQTQVSAQAMPQVIIPAKKTSGVKALLFVVLFATLGFTTYFIIQTMYPLEMGKLF